MRYRKIDVRIWGDKKFRSLSSLQPSGQALFIYLLTNPNITAIPGIYRAGAALMAEELGWSIEDFRKAFDELLQQDLVKADLDARVIFIPNAIKYNKPQSPNVIKSWVSLWDEIPECELKNLAYQEFKSFIKGMGDGFSIAFDETFEKPSGKSLGKPMKKSLSKTMLNQEQEQDQEQEHKTENVCDPGAIKGTYIQDLPSMNAHEVFKHWQAVMSHPHAKFDKKRKIKIQAAFKLGFNLDQLKQAIDGCARTSFNMGQNKNGQRYDSIELIFRDAEHIERFMQNASAKNAETSLNATISQIDKIAEGAI